MRLELVAGGGGGGKNGSSASASMMSESESNSSGRMSKAVVYDFVMDCSRCFDAESGTQCRYEYIHIQINPNTKK